MGSIGVLVASMRQQRRGLIIPAVLGLVGIIAAGFNGGSFLVFGENYSSMLMAVGFAVAMAAYTLQLSQSYTELASSPRLS
jgi:uncharacterized membrane protein YeaQ/YmgE (transglycosylase-associated protein family)